MGMGVSRFILAITGLGCVILSLAKDYVFVGQSGFGFSQSIVSFYGLILFVAAYQTPQRQPLQKGWFRLFVILLAGAVLLLGLFLHHFVDGHWVHFWRAKVLVLILSFSLSLIGCFDCQRYFSVWLVLIFLFAAIIGIGSSYVDPSYSILRIRYAYVWIPAIASFYFFLVYFVSKQLTVIHVTSFNLGVILLIFSVTESLITFQPFKETVEELNVLKTRDSFRQLSNNKVVNREDYSDGSHAESIVTLSPPSPITDLIELPKRLRICNDSSSSAQESLIFFGGSFTKGDMIADHETLPCQVKNRLPKYKVYNFGDWGYGAHQFLYNMTAGGVRRVVSVDPSYVIYSAIPDHARRLFEWKDLSPRFRLRNDTLVWLGFNDDIGIWNNLFPNLPSPRMLSKLAKAIRTIERRTVDQERVYLKVILEIDRLLKQKYPKSEFIVIYYDVLGGGGAYDHQQFFSQLQHRDGIRVLNVSAILQGPYDDNRYYVSKHNQHPNAEAFSLMADYLVKKLQ